MRLPGFHASASLYESTNVYRAAARHASSPMARALSPQFRGGQTWPVPGPLPKAPPVYPQPACPSGQTNCGGRCTDTLIDFYNCGSCGKVCPKNQTCWNGTCLCLAPYHCCEPLGNLKGTCNCVSDRYECF